MAIARERLTTEEIGRPREPISAFNTTAPKWLRWMLDFGPTVCLR